MAPHTASAAAGINHQINFQGKLVTPTGTNVTDGSYSIVYSLYNVASAGAAIWTETQTVTVSSGIFQVNLGSVTTLPGSIDFNTDNIYLGIKVGADAEMTPRVQFTSVPQAFNAEKLGGLDKTGFIQNTTVQQAASNFNISGAGVVGTNLTAGTSVIAPLLQSAAATALTITGNAASTWSTSAGNITLQAGSGTVSLGSTTSLSSTGALTVTGGTTLALTSTGVSAISLDSGTTGAINIGTSANAKAITLGNVTSTTSVVIDCGTAGCSFGASATAHPTTLGSTNSTSTTTLQAGSGGVNIGTGGIANTIQVGSTTGAVVQNINIGTNGTASSTSNVVIGSTVAGNTTIQNGSSLSLNAGIVVGNATTQDLFNTVATTLNFAGAATSLSIGAAAGTTTVNGNLAVAAGKNLVIGGANSLTLGTSSSATGSIIVNNASNAFTSTIQGNASATASYLSILPDAVGTAGQCLVLSSVVTTTQTLGYATCGGSGGANAQLSNLSGTVAINLGLLSAANNTLNLGSAANVWQNTYTGVIDAGSTTTALGVGSVNATTVTVGNSTNTTTTSIVANTTINLGNNANNKTVNIGATGTTANTSAVNIANTTSSGGASTVQIGGTGVTSGSNTGSTVTAQGGQTSLNVATGGVTLNTFTDSATAFRVQSSANKNVVGVDTSGGIVTVGQASGLTGQVAFANATNAFTSTITGNTGATASYTSILPSAVGTAGQCLAVASVATTTQTLGYASCGGATTLQTAYAASSDPEFSLGSASTAGITIRDNATPISGNLLELQNSTGTISYFGATSTGILLQRAAATTALSFSFSTGELRVYDTGASGNYAVMSYASNTATFAASTGITQIGTGTGSSGNINLILTGTADQLLTSKTNTLAAAYSVNDFKFTRSLTAGSFAATGNVMTVEDLTTFSGGSSAPNVLYVNQNNTSATGNLILAQTGGGANDKFKVTTAGNAILAGGVTIGSGASYTGTGALILQAGASSPLTINASAASTWDIGANNLSLQTTNNGAITTGNGALTTGTGLITHGGNLTFSGTSARTITGPTTGGLTINDTTGNLTVSTTTSGTLAVTSAGDLNLTGAVNSNWSTTSGAITITSATASTWSTVAGNLTIQAGGGSAIILKPATDSTSNIQFQDASGSSMLNFDSLNSIVSVGVSDSIGTLLALDTMDVPGDPTGVDGAMYYNSSVAKFRCYENFSWKDCVYGFNTITKTADQPANQSSTAFQDDSELLFAMAANTSYVIDAWIPVDDSNATADLKYTFTTPAGATLNLFSDSYSTATARIGCNIIASAQSCVTIVNSAVNFVMVRGFVSNGGTAGNLKFRFSQGTSAAASFPVIKSGATLTWHTY